MHSLRNQFILTLISLTAAHTCPGAFHLWEISQIFSNEDGSVQYIEMYNTSNFEQFLNGRDIEVSRDGGQSPDSYTFPSNLPDGDTAERFVLVATGPIAGVEPDYTIPANFLHIEFETDATVSLPFSEVPNADLTYTEIPTDGWRSLEVDGNVRAPATVTNFAGDTGTLPEPTPPDPVQYGYDLQEGGFLHAPGFLGWLYAGFAPWVYSSDTSSWWFLPNPESDLSTATGSWAWVVGIEPQHYDQALPNWLYFHSLGNWWYLPNPEEDLLDQGAWVFLLREPPS